MPSPARSGSMSARAFGFSGALPPVNYIGVTFLAANGTENMTLPAGSAAGDICICITGYNESIPAGFTLINTSIMVNNGNQYYSSGFKVLDATDITNGYITVDINFNDCGAALLTYRGISAPVFSASEESTTGSTNNATYATTAGARGVLAFNVDRDGYATGSTANGGVTKLGGLGNTYGIVVAHSLTPISNGTRVGFSSLNTNRSQMTTLITLK